MRLYIALMRNILYSLLTVNSTPIAGMHCNGVMVMLSDFYVVCKVLCMTYFL